MRENSCKDNKNVNGEDKHGDRFLSKILSNLVAYEMGSFKKVKDNKIINICL